jgi:hypothetical protein
MPMQMPTMQGMAGATPWGAIAGAAADVLKAPPTGPSEAKSSGSIGTNFDSSGWNVTFGAGSGIDAMRTQTTPSVTTSGGSMSEGGALSGLGLGGINQETAMLLVAAVLVVKMMKKRSA